MTRFLDITVSLCALLFLAPILMVTVVVLRCTGEGHVFYLQPRVGKDQKIFKLIKFATMLKDSPKIGSGEITVQNDPRVLPVGRMLRKTKINELPQLVNIIKGDMSVVGPRPLTQKNFNYYSLSAREQIASVRPGLTGVGSIIFRDEEVYLREHEDPMDFYATVIKPYKAKLEIWHLQRRSLTMYFKIIFLTGWVVLFSKSTLPERLFADLPVPPDSLTCARR